MSTFSINLRLPVASFDLNYILSTPRKPSAFEGMIVYLVDYCQRQKKFLNDTIPNVFKSILQVNDVDFFVEPAIMELFSSSLDVLRTSNYNVPRPECPIRDIEITSVGQRLLREGKLPSAPRRLHETLFYNCITGKIEDKGSNLDEYDLERLGGVNPDNYTNVFPEDILSKELWKRADEADAEITELKQISPVTFRQKFNKIIVEIIDGQISCSSYDDNVKQYLEGLDADSLRDIVLAEATAWQGNLPSTTLKLDKMSLQGLYLPKDIMQMEGKKVPVTLHTSKCELNNVIPDKLEIIATDDGSTGLDFTKTPVRFLLPLPWEAAENGISDLSSIYEVVNVRLLCKGEPLIIPMGVKMGIPDEKSIELRKQIILRLLDENDGLPMAWIVAGDHSALQKTVVDKLKTMPDIANELKQIHSQSNINVSSLLNLLFPPSELNDYSSVQNAYSIVKGSNFTDKETRAFYQRLAICTETMPTPTLDSWTTKWSLQRQLVGKMPDDRSVLELARFMPLVSNNALKDNAAAVRGALSKIGLSQKYAEICKQGLLALKEKIGLDDFIFIIKALAENPLHQKALSCDVDRIVNLPQTADDLSKFCERCQSEAIPLPDNKKLLTAQTLKGLVLEGIPDALLKIGQFQVIQTLHSSLRTLLDLANVTSLGDYVTLPRTNQANELHKACEAFKNAWRKATPDFNSAALNSCKDILTIVEKIQEDALNALRKFWVFDTCALIHNPDLLRRATNGITYIIPKIVISELDDNKDDVGLTEIDRKNVRSAISNIRKLQKSNQVTIEEGDLNLIAPEYRQDPKNDDWILSVCAMHKNNEVILVTDDKNLANKASGENVKFMDSKQCSKLQREAK